MPHTQAPPYGRSRQRVPGWWPHSPLGWEFRIQQRQQRTAPWATALSRCSRHPYHASQLRDKSLCLSALQSVPRMCLKVKSTSNSGLWELNKTFQKKKSFQSSFRTPRSPAVRYEYSLKNKNYSALKREHVMSAPVLRQFITAYKKMAPMMR